MNVTVEEIGPCKRVLHIEADIDTVNGAFDAATRHYRKNVRLPGFRPGKAPAKMIEQQFADGIKEDAKRRLLNDSYGQALKEHNLRPTSRPDIEEGELSRDAVYKYTVTVEIEPEFELPEYKGIPVRIEKSQVTDADVEKAIDVLREQKAAFEDVDREVTSGDYVVVNYTGACEGKPITDHNPTAKGLTKQENYWLEVRSDHFIPGFTDQLLGAKKGDHRTVKVDFPADFVIKEVSGKPAVYEVDLLEVKERKLPALDEAFAQSYKASSVAELRQGVTKDLENQKVENRSRAVREHLVANLLSRVAIELPETMVEEETRNVVYDIVKSNAERGIPKEALDEQQEQIAAVASNSAQERLKVRFLLERIAEAEEVQVTNEEMTHRVLQMAASYKIKPEKFVKQLREKNALGEIRSQIASAKVMDMLEKNANIEEVAPSPPGANPATPPA